MSIPLHNDHNVYILGAGFSRDAGLPLISDFLNRMRDSHEWLLKHKRTEEAEAVAEVLQFRLNAASAGYWVNIDLENIEELFSLASASTGRITSKIRMAIAATLDYARKLKNPLECQIHVTNSKGLFDPKLKKWPNWVEQVGDAQRVDGLGAYNLGIYTLYVAHLLGMFKNGNPQGENTFITFNYDTVLEDALNALNLRITYGETLGTYPSNFTGQKDTLDSIAVFKLHGSVNWARTRGTDNEIKVYNNYDEVVSAHLIPELVPPTWKKTFENQIEKVWEEAVNKLNTATRIIVIGFSMPPTDMHFKYLLAAGLRSNISLRQILFVNPDEGNEIELRVKQLLRNSYIDSRKITFKKENLAQFTVHNRGFNPLGLNLPQLGRETEYGLQFDYLGSRSQ